MTEQLTARREIPADLDITALPDATFERGTRNQLDEPERFFYWGHGSRPDVNMEAPLIASIQRNGLTGLYEVVTWDGRIADTFGPATRIWITRIAPGFGFWEALDAAISADAAKTITLEIFLADGTLAISTTYPQSDAKKMAAYRMRWLARSTNWARTTGSDGQVRTYGQVPEPKLAEEAPNPRPASPRPATPGPQTIPFTDGVPRCTTCHRAGHMPGSWQGHHFTTITREELAEAAQAERRITTRGGRAGRLTGYKDCHGNPYVAFDDGGEYAVRLDAIVSIEPVPEVAEREGVLYLVDEGRETALTAGVRVATSARGWGTLTGERARGGDLFVHFDGADYAIPVPARAIDAAVAPQPADETASPDASKGETSDCRHCAKAIRRNSRGIWGARKRSDPHPWYCDASPDSSRRHEPVATDR